MPWSLLPVPVSLVLMVVYYRARTAQDFRRVAWVQPGLTALCVCIALLSLTTAGASVPYTVMIVVSLVIAMVGDVYNIDMSDPAVVMRGLIIFCAAYLVYGAGLWAFGGSHRGDLVAGAVLLVLNAAVVAALWSGARSMRAAMVVYSGILFFMVWRGIGTWFGDVFSTAQAVLVTAGTSALLIGDLEFAVHMFRRPLRTMYGPFLYSGGQLLMALSCSFFP